MTDPPGTERPIPDEWRSPTGEDWRLTGQETYLLGAMWARKIYRAPSETWDHDHCEFCWATFMDSDHSPEDRAFMAAHPDVLSEGFASTEGQPREADYWVCDRCFADFSSRFEWQVVPEPDEERDS